jgi:HEPN domain-containing protein
VSILVHDVRDVNARVTGGDSFFRDVVSEGITLYNAGRVALAKVEPLSPVQRYRRSQAEYDFLMSQAEMSLYDVNRAMGCKWYTRAAFNLHQTVEFLFKAALVVFKGHRPKAHRLDVLGGMLAPYTKDIGAPVPADVADARRLAEILEGGYVDARYDMNFVIERCELLCLHEYVDALSERVETACIAQLDVLAREAGIEPDDDRTSEDSAR